MTGSQAIIDAEQLLGLRELNQAGERDFVSELIDLYCQQSPLLLGELEEAVKKAHFVAIEKLAHKFKGSSANIGAVRLYQLCTELETQAREQQLAAMGELLQAILLAYGEACKILREQWYQKTA